MTVKVLIVDGYPAFYIPGVNDPIPPGTFDISDTEHMLFLENQGEYAFINKQLTKIDPVPPAAPYVPVTDVAASQALIQLSRTPYQDPDMPGVDNLADATEQLVAGSTDRELKIWFSRAQRWYITNPNVRKLGARFGLSDAAIQAAFDAASQIEE
jgi:hypothetical protein